MIVAHIESEEFRSQCMRTFIDLFPSGATFTPSVHARWYESIYGRVFVPTVILGLLEHPELLPVLKLSMLVDLCGSRFHYLLSDDLVDIFRIAAVHVMEHVDVLGV